MLHVSNICMTRDARGMHVCMNDMHVCDASCKTCARACQFHTCDLAAELLSFNTFEMGPCIDSMMHRICTISGEPQER